MFQPSHAQWTVTYPTLVAPRPLRPAPHAHYHPYATRPTRHRQPRHRPIPSPAEALARISLVDHPTPPPDERCDESTISTLSSETLEEFLRILRNNSPENQMPSPATAWQPAKDAPDSAPLSAPAEWCVRKRTGTRSQSPRDHDRWSHPYRRDTCPSSRTGSEKSNRLSRGSSYCEPIMRPSPRRSGSKRASAASWASSETDVSEPADLASSQNEDIDVELASNRGDVDDDELRARSADTELDSSTCEDAPKTHSARRMTCTPASPISRRHTSNPLAHYSPMLFETLAARARANALSPSHSRSPSPSPAHVPDLLDEEEEIDPDEYQPASVVRMEMPRSSRSPPTTP